MRGNVALQGDARFVSEMLWWCNDENLYGVQNVAGKAGGRQQRKQQHPATMQQGPHLVQMSREREPVRHVPTNRNKLVLPSWYATNGRDVGRCERCFQHRLRLRSVFDVLSERTQRAIAPRSQPLLKRSDRPDVSDEFEIAWLKLHTMPETVPAWMSIMEILHRLSEL